jgi:hypothetical protein
MPKVTLELEAAMGDHTPIRVFASGIDEESLLETAEWCIDCPDPSRYYVLGDLPSPTLERLEERLREEFRAKIGGPDA